MLNQFQNTDESNLNQSDTNLNTDNDNSSKNQEGLPEQTSEDVIKHEQEVAEPKSQEVAEPKSEEVAGLKSEEVAEPKSEEVASMQEEELSGSTIVKQIVEEEEVINEAQNISEIKDENKINIEDFDWEEYQGAGVYYSSVDRESQEKMYIDTMPAEDANKAIIQGTIIAQTDKDFIIDIQAKSEGVISGNEFRYNPDLKVGDVVDVMIDKKENSSGQLVLSHKKARAAKAWENVLEAHKNQTVVPGYVKCRTKGGMIVEVFGLESFLPGSQIDVKPIRDYDVYVGKNMEFKVVKINHEFQNVVVSHKALIEEDIEQQKKEIISKLDKGQVLEGAVKNITSYGVFVDLGGVDGLIHITDLSWNRISHPNEVVELDQVIKVVTLDFDEKKTRIQLGLKQLTSHPWESLDESMKVGDNIKANVVVLADYGAFVEIQPGVEALIHVSEMSWSTHLRSAQDFLKLGDEVEAQILTLDREERKMSLGIKQLYPDPWVEIAQKYPIQSTHTGVVKNFTNFGIFIELEEGVDGLVHISDLSWTKKVKHPADFTKVGDKLEVLVLELDTESRRLSLGHKQLQENPWDVYETIFTVDSVHEADVVDFFDKGATVLFKKEGLEGYVPKRYCMKADKTKLEIGNSEEFKVLEFSKDARRIIVCLKDNLIDFEEDEKQTKKKEKVQHSRVIKEVQSKISKSTLGDLDALSDLKNKIEDQ